MILGAIFDIFKIQSFFKINSKNCNMKKLVLIPVLALSFGVAKAQIVDRVMESVSSVTGTAGEITENGGNAHVEGVGHQKTFRLSGGVLHVEGASNKITIKGFASKIIVEGAGNTVYVDKVNNVSIEGASNKVYYKSSGNRNNRPNSRIEGANSVVIKQK